MFYGTERNRPIFSSPFDSRLPRKPPRGEWVGLCREELCTITRFCVMNLSTVFILPNPVRGRRFTLSLEGTTPPLEGPRSGGTPGKTITPPNHQARQKTQNMSFRIPFAFRTG